MMREYSVNGGTRALCQHMKADMDLMGVYKQFWTVTGDQTGMNESAVSGHINNYDIIQEEFGLTNRQLVNVQADNCECGDDVG